MDALSADERIRLWLAPRCRIRVPKEAPYLHYRDCPDVEVYNYSQYEAPLSTLTADIWTYFHASWGCPHGPARFSASVNYHDTLSSMIDALAAVEDFTLGPDEPFFARNYPAPNGTVWSAQS